MRVADVIGGWGRKVVGACHIALALLLLAGSAVRAQSARPLSVELSAGAALPFGSTVYDLGTGYQLQAGVERTVAGPLALRAEGMLNHFSFTYTPVLPCPLPGCTPQKGRERTVAATLNAILQPADSGRALVGYLIAGAGLYNHDNNASGGISGTDLGVNGGAGVRVPRLHAFVEARAHVVKNAPNYLPITVGIRF